MMIEEISPDVLAHTRELAKDFYLGNIGILAALCDDCARRVAYFRARTNYARDALVPVFVDAFMEERQRQPPLKPEQIWFYGTLPPREGKP